MKTRVELVRALAEAKRCASRLGFYGASVGIGDALRTLMVEEPRHHYSVKVGDVSARVHSVEPPDDKSKEAVREVVAAAWGQIEDCACGHSAADHAPLPGHPDGVEECQAGGCDCGRFRQATRAGAGMRDVLNPDYRVIGNLAVSNSHSIGLSCLNCRHWLGDKSRMRAEIERSDGRALDEERGWAESGKCSQAHRLETEVDCGTYCQGGRAVILFPAWFGCVMFDEQETP